MKAPYFKSCDSERNFTCGLVALHSYVNQGISWSKTLTLHNHILLQLQNRDARDTTASQR